MMRKLAELTVVFLLGWALAWYFIPHQERGEMSDPVVSGENATPKAPVSVPTDPLSSLSVPAGNAAELLKLEQQLALNDIDGFMLALRGYHTAGQEALWHNARAVFFQALQGRKDRRDYRGAVQWLTVYLRTEYDDVAALQAIAEFHYLMANHLAAIDALYQAKAYAHGSEKTEEIVAAQRAITAEYSKRLQNDNNPLELLDLYQRLVSAEPEHSAHYIGLAEAYLALGNETDARKTLAIIAYDPDANTKVHQLLALIDSQSAETAAPSDTVALTRHGNNLIAEALFNDRIYGRLLLDTGASLTVITPQLLQELSLQRKAPLRKAWFNTANGVVEAPIYLIDRITLGGQSVDRLEVAVMELGGQHINGLLGMNFLQHFRFSIDQQNSALYLSPRG